MNNMPTGDICLQEPYSQKYADSPDEGKLQADVAMKIQRLIGIIPPPRMKTLIHQPPGNQFNQRGKQYP